MDERQLMRNTGNNLQRCLSDLGGYATAWDRDKTRTKSTKIPSSVKTVHNLKLTPDSQKLQKQHIATEGMPQLLIKAEAALEMPCYSFTQSRVCMSIARLSRARQTESTEQENSRDSSTLLGTDVNSFPQEL